MLPGHHKGEKRDYPGEERTYKGTPEQIKLRSSRNKARRLMEKKLGHKLPTRLEVDHKNANAADDRMKNLQVLTEKANDSKGHHKARTRKK